MFKTIKESLATVGWFAVGVTAIAGEKAYLAGKTVVEEVKDGNPQDLARHICDDFKSRFESSPEFTRVTNPDESRNPLNTEPMS